MTTTTTTTIRIDVPAQWRAGDVLTVFDADGKEILRAVLTLWSGELRIAGSLSAARFFGGEVAPWLYYDGRTYTVTREVPAIPTEPNALIVDVETSLNRLTYTLGRYDAIQRRWNLYSARGLYGLSVAPDEITAYTPATIVPGERVEATR